MVGFDGAATDGLNEFFAQAETDHRFPLGYYTDHFTVAAPQLGDIAEYAQTVFASRYKTRYGADPDPEAVRLV